MAKKVDHTHGDNGTKPTDTLNFERGDKPDPQVFDWFWSEVPAAINDHADELDAIDADDDGTVDAAETAAKVKGNDIDSDGDGIVDKADSVVGGTGNEYTDSDAVSAVDGEVDNASTSVAGLDDTVAGKSDEGHDHTEASETQIPDSGLVENYVTSAESSSYTDVDAISAVDGEVNNAASTVAGLDDAVAGKAEDTEVSSIQSSSDVDHDSTSGGTDSDAHHSRYTNIEALTAVNNVIDNAADSVAELDDAVNSLSGLVAGKASDNHDNNQHSTNYLPSDADANIGFNTSVSNNVDFDGNQLDNVGEMTFYWDGTVGLGFQPESGANVSSDHALQTFVGLEVGSQEISTDIFAGGDLKAAGNKPFVIEHPSDDTKTLRHCAYEGPVSGGLIYRDQVEVVNGEASVDLPDYVTNGDFGTDWVQSVTPKKHFGTGYLDTDTWTVKADSDGTYDVIVMGQRTDSQGLAGLGGITTKDKDESWDEAADRFYGGATDVDGNEVATDDDEYRQTTLYAHAESQHEADQ